MENGGLNDGEIALDLIIFIPPLVGWIVAIAMLFSVSTEKGKAYMKKAKKAFEGAKSRFQSSATSDQDPQCAYEWDSWDLGMRRRNANWFMTPRAVISKSTASVFLAVMIVEIILLGFTLLDVDGNKSTSRMLLWPLVYLPIEYFGKAAFKSIDIVNGEVDKWGYLCKSLGSVIITYAGWCFITQAVGVRDKATVWYPLGGFLYTIGFLIITVYLLFGGAKSADKEEKKLFYTGEKYAVLTVFDILMWCVILSTVTIWTGFALATNKAYDNIAFVIFPAFVPLFIHFLQNMYRSLAPRSNGGKNRKRGIFNIFLIAVITTTLVLLHVQMCQLESFERPGKKVSCPSTSKPSDEAFWNHNGVYIVVLSCIVTWLLLFLGVLDTSIAVPQGHFDTDCIRDEELKKNGVSDQYTYRMPTYKQTP